MRLTLGESYPGELAELSETEVLEKAEKALCSALRELGKGDLADVLEDRVGALLEAEKALTGYVCATHLRKGHALPERGGELDVVALLSGRMVDAYDAQNERLTKRLAGMVLDASAE